MQKVLGIIFVLALLALIVFLGLKILELSRTEDEARENVSELAKRVQTASLEAAQIQANLEYFRRQENLEKEMRSRFNFRLPDEKLMILVPGPEIGATTSSSSTVNISQ